MIRPLALAVLSTSLSALAGCTASQVHGESQAASTRPSASRVRSECPNFKDVAVKQQTPVWCWAASAEMVHKYYGDATVTQERLAKQITDVSGADEKKAKAAGLQQIMVALNPDYEKRVAERSGQMLTARAQAGSAALPSVDVLDVALGQTAPWSASSDDLIDAISTQHPAIVGLRGQGQTMGHAVVVYATSYEPVRADAGKAFGQNLFNSVAKGVGSRHGVRDDQVDASGLTKGPAKYALSEIEYVDPMDGKRYKLNAEGFKNRVDFIMTKARAREILDRQLNAVR